MHKRYSKRILLGIGTALLTWGCTSDHGVPAQSSSASAAPQVTINPADIVKDPTSGLVQIGGQCKAGNGDITVDGSVNGKSQVPCSGGTFLICTLLPQLGPNNVDVIQTGPTQSHKAELNISEEQPNLAQIELEITAIQVLSPTSANITIKCKPNSALSATIYGAQQLGSESACPSTGAFTFPVALVAGLAGTGQRVVYVDQITQEGRTDTVFADVDNVVTAHNCAITQGQGNTDLCVASAGTVSGTCKAGSPVKLLVNDEAEKVVGCKSDNTFRADDVVLTRPGSNKISIVQKTPFNTTCTADKNVSAFSQIQ